MCRPTSRLPSTRPRFINDCIRPVEQKQSIPKNNECSKQQTLEEPKQPLSSYNLFFQVERQRILNGTDHPDFFPITNELVQSIIRRDKSKPSNKRVHKKTHGKIGFRELARTIAARWKKIDPMTKKIFDSQARVEKENYLKKRTAWKAMKKLQEDANKQLGQPTPEQAASSSHDQSQRREEEGALVDWEPLPYVEASSSNSPLDGLCINVQNTVWNLKQACHRYDDSQRARDSVTPSPDYSTSFSLEPEPIPSCSLGITVSRPVFSRQDSLASFEESDIVHDAFDAGYDLFEAMNTHEIETIFAD